MDWPPVGRVCLPTLGVLHDEFVGAALRNLSAISGTTSTAFPAANRAIYIPFTLPARYPMARIWWANGATATGNIAAGILTEAGVALGAVGATAQAGTTIVQSAALALDLPPGAYYLGLTASSTSSTLRAWAVAVAQEQALGMAQEALGSTAMPAVATFATVASAYLPLCGITSQSVI